MKRILFYVILAGQVSIILFLSLQFEKVEQNGFLIKLLTLNEDEPMYAMPLEGNMYIEYEINKIDKAKFASLHSLEYNDRLYVHLKSDQDGIFHVQHVSTEKITTNQPDEIVLPALYHYRDPVGNHYVQYGLERIDHAKQFGDFQTSDQLIVSILIGKFGQQKIIQIEQTNRE